MVAGAAGSALAQKTVEADVKMGASLNMMVETSGCSNRGGPYIRITGDLLGGGIKGKLRRTPAACTGTRSTPSSPPS
jgi:hypothetical protein